MACDQEFAGYADTNQDINLTADAVDEAMGQTFTTAGAHTLCGCKFHLRYDFGVGETATIEARLYDVTGTVGSTAVPTGAALATSNAISLTSADDSAGVFAMREFTFPTPYDMAAGDYAIVVIVTAHGGAGADVKVGVDNSSPTHGGNTVKYYTSWSTDTKDTIFSCLEDPGAGGGAVGHHGNAAARMLAGGFI